MTQTTLRALTTQDSKLFLKSEYGALSHEWPVVAFSVPALKNLLNREYRTGLDFIIYTGTSGVQTLDANDRSRLLSVAEIDTTKTYRTQDVISKTSWDWATKEYPGQWEHAFRVLRGWDLPSRPSARDLIGNSYSMMGKYPYRSTALELHGSDRAALLDLPLTPIENIDIGSKGKRISVSDILRPENKALNQEAKRLSDLVFSRVRLSGQVIQTTAPIRNAPTDLFLQIANLLSESPLTCQLCGGIMQLQPTNRLLQASGDRKDSELGDYGPRNYQLVHLACNLGKNSSSDADFQEWLNVIRDAV